jgi:hypothetical protein
VSLHGDLSRALTVNYRVSGAASNGVDYQPLSGVVTIPSDSPSAIIEVIPLHDTLVEGTESVIHASTPASSATRPRPIVIWWHPGHITSATTTKPTGLHGGHCRPANGAVFTAPVDLRLVAAAGDSDGWVTTVEFLDGDTSIGIVHNPIVILDPLPIRLPELGDGVLTGNSWTRPFVLVWSNAPPGKHVVLH